MFELQQGIESPRDNSVNWQTYDTYLLRAEAVKAGRSFKGMWRVVEIRVVWEKATNK